MQLLQTIAARRGEMAPGLDEVKDFIESTTISNLSTIHTVNNTIYANPQLAWEETIAHDIFVEELGKKGFHVTPSAYGVRTAFEVTVDGKAAGRTVNFNAEYDALPGIGHACGHNLISVAGLTGFLALSALVEAYGLAGRVQLLGTPAEEAGGGKIALLKSGAYNDVDVSLMGHPFSTVGHGPDPKYTGSAGQRSIANLGLFATFHGKNAHAAANPWNGVNALDAVVCAYNNVSFLRQQMRPKERVHGCILESPKVTNVIPGYTKMEYSVRAPTLGACRALADKVKNCFGAAALATGCRVELEEEDMYADLRINKTLCSRYAAAMARFGERVLVEREDSMAGSTDQGNVTYAVPALHVIFGLPNKDNPDINPHNAEFAECAGTEEAFQAAVRCGKGMALTGWEILTNDALWEQCKADFKEDKKTRG